MPATHATTLQSVYEEVAEGYQKAHSSDISTAEIDLFLSFLPKNPKILDLGAGTGRDSAYFLSKNCDVTMFDLSPAMLAIAWRNAPQAKAIVGDMTEVDFPERSFDGIWACASLLHLTKLECNKVLLSLFKFLKQRGILFIKVKEGVGEKDVADDKYGRPMRRFFSFYSQDELEMMLKHSGFEILESQVTTRSSSSQKWIVVLARKN